MPNEIDGGYVCGMCNGDGEISVLFRGCKQCKDIGGGCGCTTENCPECRRRLDALTDKYRYSGSSY